MDAVREEHGAIDRPDRRAMDLAPLPDLRPGYGVEVGAKGLDLDLQLILAGDDKRDRI